MILGRELYAFNRAMEALVPHEGSVAAYERALAEWDASPELRAMGADTETPGTWGWWAARLVSAPRCATCRWAQPFEGHDGAHFECHRIPILDSAEEMTGLAVVFASESADIWVAPDFGCVMWEAKP